MRHWVEGTCSVRLEMDACRFRLLHMVDVIQYFSCTLIQCSCVHQLLLIVNLLTCLCTDNGSNFDAVCWQQLNTMRRGTTLAHSTVRSEGNGQESFHHSHYEAQAVVLETSSTKRNVESCKMKNDISAGKYQDISSTALSSIYIYILFFWTSQYLQPSKTFPLLNSKP